MKNKKKKKQILNIIYKTAIVANISKKSYIRGKKYIRKQIKIKNKN